MEHIVDDRKSESKKRRGLLILVGSAPLLPSEDNEVGGLFSRLPLFFHRLWQSSAAARRLGDGRVCARQTLALLS